VPQFEPRYSKPEGDHMGQAYQPELWRDLYVMLGTSSAALIGLLFIVTSLHLDEIVKNQIFRIRAHNQTIYLLMLLAEATLILVQQPMRVLGAELVVINLFGLCFPFSNAYRQLYKNKEMSISGGLRIYRSIIYFMAFLLGVFGGAGPIQLSNWSMYQVTASYFTILAMVVLNAWALMLGVAESETTTKAN
jgi:hypothetical protein